MKYMLMFFFPILDPINYTVTSNLLSCIQLLLPPVTPRIRRRIRRHTNCNIEVQKLAIITTRNATSQPLA
jgi:hypothetical protein